MTALSMIPYYLFSNFHCFGMCGPIAALIGRHPFWHFYLIGRVCGFSTACTLFGAFGQTISWEMGPWSGILSIAIGLLMIAWTFSSIAFAPLKRWAALIQNGFIILFAKNNPWTAFLIGFLTPLLPCGQSLILFAFSALLGDPFDGFIQGFLFGLLTTPSLFLAIKGFKFMTRYKKIVDPLLQFSVGCVGLLAALRGLAELGIISHYTLVPHLHLILW